MSPREGCAPSMDNALRTEFRGNQCQYLLHILCGQQKKQNLEETSVNISCIYYVGSKRRVGRPDKTMDQRVEELGPKRGKLVNELKTMTQDRRMWRTWVEAPHQPTP
ncbi:hypothetical protein QE152_g21526 [Popillia japonica]|uniref:Uncharacterized protein n=1 Tax=Popillia japonica TaxID=7064 RepID=A0AAW1KP81_POPJA